MESSRFCEAKEILWKRLAFGEGPSKRSSPKCLAAWERRISAITQKPLCQRRLPAQASEVIPALLLPPGDDRHQRPTLTQEATLHQTCTLTTTTASTQERFPQTLIVIWDTAAGMTTTRCDSWSPCLSLGGPRTTRKISTNP